MDAEKIEMGGESHAPANTSRLKIAFVVPSLLRGGAETQTVDLVNGLDGSLFEKHLFVFEPEIDQAGRINRAEVKVHHWPRRHKWDSDPIRKLADLIDSERIDIVHCTLQIALLMGWSAKWLSDRRPTLMAAIHITRHITPREALFDRLLYQWLMRDCARIIWVCNAQAEYWKRRFPFVGERSEVVHNGVRPEWFDPRVCRDPGIELRRQLGIDRGKFVICCVAGFRPEKAHEFLIRTFANFVGYRPDSVLILAGDGAERRSAEDLVGTLGLERVVHFLGSVSDVRPVLAASDISVLASTSESFSISMLESMAMEVPVVATDVGGTKEAVIDGQTGYLVPSGDAKALQAAFSAAASDRPKLRRMGIAGRRLVCERFTRDEMLSRVEKALMAVGREYGDVQVMRAGKSA